MFDEMTEISVNLDVASFLAVPSETYIEIQCYIYTYVMMKNSYDIMNLIPNMDILCTHLQFILK